MEERLFVTPQYTTAKELLNEYAKNDQRIKIFTKEKYG